MNPQLQSSLQQGIQAFRDKNFDGANLILQEILRNNINSVDAIFELGISYAKANRFEEASTIFCCLEVYKKDDVRIPYNLGLIHSLQGKHQLALAAYDLALNIQPNDIEVLINKGSTCNDIKNYVLALEVLEKAIHIRPNIPEAWSNKGIALNNLNLYQESINAYDEALKLKPNYREAWFNKGITLHELKRFDEAIAHYDKALYLKPDYHEAWSNKGNTLYELKRFDEAIAHYDKALYLKPDYHEAWSNKGITLHELKRFDEAIAHYDKALYLKPDYHEAWSNKGNTLYELKRFDEAIAHYDKALYLKPDFAKYWSNKGVVLSELGRFNEAIDHYEKALDLNPNIDWTQGDLFHAKMKICRWVDLADYSKNISKKVLAKKRVATPFALLAMNDDAALHKKCSEIFSQAKHLPGPILDPISKLAKKEKIRIGYFSPDFRSHPLSFLTSELFEIHDRGRFEIFAFSLQKALVGDEINLRLRKGFDRFIDADDMSDWEISQLARELEVDIAIDLAGPTQYSRSGIFSNRAAPIQVNWLGYPGTSGADFMDYILADKTIIPESCQEFYTEKVVYLPDTYIVDDTKRVSSSRVFTRGECGLPQHAFVFCCFNNDYKFNSQVLNSWSKILLTAKNSILWLSENNKSFRTNLVTEFKSRGIDSSRIIFAQRVEMMADHLSRYALADLFLDTHPYNAHTTALDSLKSGIPVLTLMGQSFASRVAASILNAIGLPELIANNREEYEALAIDLALNPKKLMNIKLKLANNLLTAPLFNTPLFAQNLEAAYIEMIERYDAGLQPDHISIA